MHRGTKRTNRRFEIRSIWIWWRSRRRQRSDILALVREPCTHRFGWTCWLRHRHLNQVLRTQTECQESLNIWIITESECLSIAVTWKCYRGLEQLSDMDRQGSSSHHQIVTWIWFDSSVFDKLNQSTNTETAMLSFTDSLSGNPCWPGHWPPKSVWSPQSVWSSRSVCSPQ